MHPLDPSQTLDPSQKEFFAENGYLALPNFINEVECDELRAEALRLLQVETMNSQKAVFSTRNQTDTTEQYFLDSGDKIRMFFEEGALDAKGELKQTKELSINKIGHALHKLNPVFEKFSQQAKIRSLANDLPIETPTICQSTYIFKQPRIGGEVVCHQDSTFLHTEPLSTIGLWFALEDATTTNGCLWGIPKKHHQPLKKRFVLDSPQTTSFTVLDSEPWPEENSIPLEASKGTLIVLHGSFPHLSRTNHSEKSRHAYVLHMINGKANYSKDNWLKYSAETFTALKA